MFALHMVTLNRIRQSGYLVFQLLALQVIGVSLPQDQGRQKGFGYAEFEDRQSLIQALSLNDEVG